MPLVLKFKEKNIRSFRINSILPISIILLTYSIDKTSNLLSLEVKVGVEEIIYRAI